MMFGRGFGYGYGGHFGLPFMGLAGFLLTVLFIALLIRLAMRAAHGHGVYARGCCGHAAVHEATAGQPAAPLAGPDEAVAIARRRLATGDITAEQYAEIIEHLSR